MEGRAEGSAFLGLFFRRARGLSTGGEGGLLTPQQGGVPGASSLRASGAVATLLGAAKPLLLLVLFSAQRAVSAFQGLGHAHPRTPQTCFPT